MKMVRNSSPAGEKNLTTNEDVRKTLLAVEIADMIKALKIMGYSYRQLARIPIMVVNEVFVFMLLRSEKSKG